MRAFTSKGRRAAPCCDTRPAPGCQGLFLSQSSINICVNKQKGIHPETSRLLLFINQSTTKQFPLHLLFFAPQKQKKDTSSVVSHSLQLHGLGPSQILSPWDFPGKNTGVGNHFFLQGMLPAQASILYRFRLVSPA